MHVIGYCMTNFLFGSVTAFKSLDYILDDATCVIPHTKYCVRTLLLWLVLIVLIVDLTYGSFIGTEKNLNELYLFILCGKTKKKKKEYKQSTNRMTNKMES